MKSKKGFMLGEYTLKMIIAVLCILLLLYLLFSLYSNNKDQKNLQLAEATLDELTEKMEEAKDNGNSQMILLNPNKWVLVSFVGQKKPRQCINNCICICIDDEPGFHVFSSEIELCNAIGTCKNFGEDINEFKYQIRESGKISSLWGILMGSAEELNINFKDSRFTITKE